jgi:ATP-dependent Clp protease adaptor protein ClpS
MPLVLNFPQNRTQRCLRASVLATHAPTPVAVRVADRDALGDDGDAALLEREDESTPQLKRPPRYAVLLLNDDYTPMEFVVAVLQHIFNKNTDESVAIMLKVHHDGRGVCGVYTRDIADTRVAQVAAMAAKFEHPLQCIAQVIDDDN